MNFTPDIEKIVKHHYPSKNLPKWVNKDLFYKEKMDQLKRGIIRWEQEIDEDEDADLASILDYEFLIPLQSIELDLRTDYVMDIIDETIIVPKSLVEKKVKKGPKSTKTKKVAKAKKTKVAKAKKIDVSSDDEDSESEEPPKAKKVVKSKKTKVAKAAKKKPAKAKKPATISLYRDGKSVRGYFAKGPLKEGDEFVTKVKQPVTGKTPKVYYSVIDRKYTFLADKPLKKDFKLEMPLATNYGKLDKEWNTAHPDNKLGHGKYVRVAYQNKMN
jgi:hypothetical protein